MICIWDAETAEFESKKKMPKGCRLVTAIGFSATGKWIAASDAAEKITVYLFNRTGGVGPVSNVSINMKVVHLAWCPTDDNLLATAGNKHLAVYTVEKDKLGGPKKDTVTSMCSVAWANDEKYKGQLVCGGADGKLYHKRGKDEASKPFDNNKGSVHSVALRLEAGAELCLVGGNDKTLTAYTFAGKLSAKDKLW